jgi:hypothetical protein
VWNFQESYNRNVCHHFPQMILRNTSHECKAISYWLTRRYSKRLSQWPSRSQNSLPLFTKTGRPSCMSCYCGRYRISGAPTSTTDSVPFDWFLLQGVKLQFVIEWFEITKLYIEQSYILCVCISETSVICLLVTFPLLHGHSEIVSQ